MQNRLFRVVCLPLMMVGVFVSSSSAQNTFDDVLEYLGSSPPDQWNPNTLVQYKKVIAWKRQQLESMHARLAEPRDQIKKELEAMSQKVEELQDSLPVELQFSTAETRAQLATHAAQLILDTKLDLAVSEVRIISIANLEPAVDEEAIKRKRLDAQELETSLEIAKAEFEEMNASVKQGLAPAIGLRRAEANLKNQQIRLEKIRSEMIELETMGKSQLADRLTELRIEKKPLQARLEVAEAFLNTIRESGTTIRKIEQLERERELMMRDLEWVAGQLASISRELLELQNLSELIEQENKKREIQQPAIEKPAVESPALEGKETAPEK